MQKEETYYRSLILGFIDNTLSPDEIEEVLKFIQTHPPGYDHLLNSQEIKDRLSAQAYNSKTEISEAASLRMKEKLMAAVQHDNATGTERKAPVRVLTRTWRRIAAAAIVIAIGTVVFMAVDRSASPGKAPGVAKTTVNDVLPGGNRATLQLANGQTIILDSAANGSLAIQGNATIVKLADGQIVYTVDGKPATDVMYNTMSTPPGGQFKLTLPDGTNVWLNAASSITYPTAFIGKEREVSITGEVYFEVTKNRSKPFHVKVNAMDVEVLGTHFNINAYADEAAVKTTLLEGSVKVRQSATGPAQKQEQPAKNTERAVVLKPGQQAVMAAVNSRFTVDDSRLTIDRSPDIEQVMAWKNGLFNFNRVSLQEVMKQIARWYDVEIVYQGKIKPKQFGGEIQRDLNLSEVLEGLSKTGIHFKIEGRKLIVLP
jgi:transmembrane sensor